MNAAFMHLDKFLVIMEECAPNVERISKVRRVIEKEIASYRELYNEKIINGGIQSTLYKFIKKNTRGLNLHDYMNLKINKYV
ncbi:hypothetical protein HZS_815 [Henneguya salminicola]|nr:hypothetical protein HZS_815 [Henneguya salminicola]